MRSDIDWESELADVSPNVSLSAIFNKFKGRCQKSTLMRQLKRRKISYTDGRIGRQEINPKWQSADWSKSDLELAGVFGVTKQRINAMRKRLSPKQPVSQPTDPPNA